jgi:hypothetical protein
LIFFQKKGMAKALPQFLLDGENKKYKCHSSFLSGNWTKNPHNSESLILPNSRTSSKQQKKLCST